MRTVLRCIHSLPTANLRHPPYSSTPKARILIAVTPAIDRPLNQPALSPQTWIKLSQCPSHGVTLSLIVQPVALVLVFGATGPRVHAVFSLEFLRECDCVYRLDITPNSVLHLHSVSRVLERNPLHAILVLANDKRRRCWNWTWCRIWIGTRRALLVHLWRSSRRCGLRTHTRTLSLELAWLHLLAWAPSKAGSYWMGSVLE